MKTFDSYELLITPLSPVHIGTGDSYEPTNYVIEDDALHEFSVGEIVDILSKIDHELLLKIVEQRPGEEMIKSVQRFFYERRSTLIVHARNTIPVLEGVAALYRERVGQTAQRETGGRQIINRLEIDRTAFNPITRRPVLYGSSLKGAIRTALLDAVNERRPLKEIVDRKTNRPRKENNAEFQQRLFGFRAGKFELDPLRLVQISDASWRGEPELPASEVHLAVNRKKAPVVDERGNLRVSQAEQKGLYQILECVAGLRYRALDAQLNIQSVDSVDKPGELPDSSLRFDIRQLARACSDFYRPILVEENRLLAGRGLLREPWHSGIEALLAGEVGEKMERGELFLMRVGRHSGAESVTVRGVRTIKIMRASDQQPEYAPSAKTVWLAAGEPAQQKDMLPFGWLLVEVFPPGGERHIECDGLKTVCETHLGPARTWAARQVQVAQERAREQAEHEARRRQEEEQAQQRAEELQRVARLEAERLAKLAAMSEEEHAIEDLRAIYEADKKVNRKEPQGELAGRRVGLLRQAKAWESAEMRGKAADLIEETVRWLPWPKQKRADRMKELDELRNR